LHALPAPPARRRYALPGVLLGVAVLAVSALAVLPAPVAVSDVLLVQRAAAAPQLAVPPVDERLPAKVAPKPVVKAKPKPKPTPRPTAKRVSRSKRAVAADLGGSGYFCPVAGRRSFSDTWGDSRSGGRHHQGTDIMAAYGTPLVAVIAGTIKTAYSSAGGISLYLRGVDGDEYFYAHNSRNVASNGERVAAGEVIAYVGTSGNAPDNAPHVHFERHPGGGAAVNPYAFVVRACR
jgi:murein DD-endopeptidase MepM/ murein hydrolase activator NlpD